MIKSQSQRKELLDILYKHDALYMSEYPCTQLSLEKYKDIYDIVLWLEKELQLSDIQTNALSNKGIKIENSILGIRQYNCFNLSLIRVSDGLLGAAYHEICDFIHNYKLTINEPLNSLELMLLSMWVIAFKEKYKSMSTKDQ